MIESSEEPAPFKKGERVAVRRALSEKLAEGRRKIIENGIGKELVTEGSDKLRIGTFYRVLDVDPGEQEVCVGSSDLSDDDIKSFPTDDWRGSSPEAHEKIAAKYGEILIFKYGELMRVLELE